MNKLSNQQSARRTNAGYSLVEMLTGVTVLSVFSTLGLTMINRQNDAIEDLELQQQIKSINAAAQAYEFSGGDLGDAGTPEEVISRLKSTADVDQKDQVAGLAGAMIDLRLKVVKMDTNDAATEKPRAIWDATAKRFRYATSGTGAVAEFILSDDAIPTETRRETRKLSTEYASVDGWVWDYTDQAASSDSAGADGESVTSTFGDVPMTESAPTSSSQLLAPEFSVPGGEWEYPQFADFEVELINPNNEGSSSVFYSINDGPFELYTGALNIGPDTEVKAFAQSLDPVSYTDSDLDQEMYAAIPQLFVGTALGEFSGATGGDNMTTSTSADGLVSQFQWGVGANGSDASSLTFSGSEFTALGNGALFNLGTIDFFNGTIYSSTGADSVDLNLSITFTVPETAESFIFDLSLENTRNYGYSEDADADFVRIDTPQSNFETDLNGVTYALGLQFGYEGDDGFATVDEFHVHEGSTATADIYGVFVAVDYEEPTP